MSRRPTLAWFYCLLLVAVVIVTPARAGMSQGAGAPVSWEVSPSEQQFLAGIEAISANQLDEAVGRFSRLSQEMPDFRLANLVYGDLLMAKAAPLRGEGRSLLLEGGEAAPLLDEARSRLTHWRERPVPGTLPVELVHLSPGQARVVVVDLAMSRLYLFANDGDVPRLVADYYATVGLNGAGKFREGDKKTPVGLYFVTGEVPASRLTAFFGSGALALDYPNAWDRRMSRTGSGIWLHGSPLGQYSRPPRATEGCVALTNPDFSGLMRLVGAGTPVLIAERTVWQSVDSWRRQRDLFIG
ncbi:MAG: L,D-transpeptidase, partial [Magnetococcales bacterium]|nr:L,D-transpeptidase [Magnetococcales bacterium]